MTDELVIILHWVILQSVKDSADLIKSGFGTFPLLTHGCILFELCCQSLLFAHQLTDVFFIDVIGIIDGYRLQYFLKFGFDFRYDIVVG